MALKKPYLISVYALIQNENEEYLLLRRSKYSRTQPGKWDLPGGKVDPGETLEEAVTREAQEETGLFVEPQAIAGEVTFELSQKKVIAVVYETEARVSGVKLSSEHEAFEWISGFRIAEMEELPAYFRNFFRKYLEECFSFQSFFA
ncbi:MAG: NUDIX domain-containing protein [Methanosarcinaceae archaeon]|nr:NUDIX domain-containing protein [Methanosarcinaceae archaeon]MDD4748736.1 NUDIX domain-containing protein [Methanosarcinaceae archaeon]